MRKSVVVSVSTAAERDIITRNIYDQLENDPDIHEDYVIHQDRVNRIRVMYKGEDVITYIVVIIPVIFNLKPLEGITGKVEFHLDTTINILAKHLRKLQKLQQTTFVKESVGTEAFEQLMRSLS